MRWQAIRKELVLLLILFGGQASFGQERVAPSGTEQRSNHDWLLACVLSYPTETTPIVLGQITQENAREVARRAAKECYGRLASPEVRDRLAEITTGVDLIESANQYPAAVHGQWLIGCIEDVAAVQPGTQRAELDLHFRPEGGISWPQHRSFYHRECKYLQIGMDFQSVVERPGDIVTATEPLELDLVRAD